MGSLLSALGSYLDARANNGKWLLRIEDIDPPREQPGASLLICASLRAHGLHWDEELLFQHTRGAAYDQTLEYLLCRRHAYYCTCSRLQLAQRLGRHTRDCPQSGQLPPEPAAIRLRHASATYSFDDSVLGPVEFAIEADATDPVIRRKDGLYAYQLAVVVDDAHQGISDVVRGCDLLDSTPGQLHLQQLLGLPTPRYGHLPLLLNEQGQKLSKQNLAPPLDDARAPANLLLCLAALGQPSPPVSIRNDCAAILGWAARRWDRARIPRQSGVAREN
jgi:glutamyl-Q tRNA(Asp) synthetase